MSKKVNKYLYGWRLYVNYGYGHGWEYEIFEESYREIRQRVKEYRENCCYPLKVTQSRELNPAYS